jgi:hypothetical protein
MEPPPQPPALIVFDPTAMELFPEDDGEMLRPPQDLVLADEDVAELDLRISVVVFSGSAQQYACERARILGQLLHWVRNWAATQTRIGSTNLLWTQYLSAKALGFIYASRGYLTKFSVRVATNGNFLKDAAAAFFAFIKRIPSSGIPRLDAAAFGRPAFVEAAAKATAMQEEVYLQMAGAWRVVSGQQAEADVKRRLSIRGRGRRPRDE